MRGILLSLLFVLSLGLDAQESKGPALPEKVYVPYAKLKDVFEKADQGVFLPYKEFVQLWQKAQGKPASVKESPVPYLVSTARFSGKVQEKIARISVDLTFDVLGDDWTTIPVGLQGVAVADSKFTVTPIKGATPLLQVRNGAYALMVKGKGRWGLKLDFVKQLTVTPGRNTLAFGIPRAAVTTLDLVIPEENMSVDVNKVLAATTTQLKVAGQKNTHTKLMAFLGSARSVELSWQPKSDSASGLTPVVVCEQLQHIDVAEAMVSYQATLKYNIYRSGIKQFNVQLPNGFRVTAVNGQNISKWDVKKGATASTLNVDLFAAAKKNYELQIRLERFLKDANATIPIAPIVTQGALRSSGIIAVSRANRRSVELQNLTGLMRVDVARLPRNLQGRTGITAYSFSTGRYSLKLAIATVYPRIKVSESWFLGVEKNAATLSGKLNYQVSRAGVFHLDVLLPKPWSIDQVGPKSLIEDHEVITDGGKRVVRITLKKLLLGNLQLDVRFRTARAQADDDIAFVLPAPAPRNLASVDGKLLVLLDESLRAEVTKSQHLQPMPLRHVTSSQPSTMSRLKRTMAFRFRGTENIDKAGATLGIKVRPAQVSATVHRLVNIESGSVRNEIVAVYSIRYAPVNTFYLRLHKSLKDVDIEISGADIKEKPTLQTLPAGLLEKDLKAGDWFYRKIVLQSAVNNRYTLTVSWRSPSPIGREADSGTVEVAPIFAAGKLTDQVGYIAVGKARNLAIGETKHTKLVPGDAASTEDLPWAAHRSKADLAFKFNSPDYTLQIPVRFQKEAEVYTTIVNGMIVEQILTRDGAVNGRAIYIITTSRGDRLPIKLGNGGKFYAFYVDGKEVTVETPAPDTRVVRLPHSASQVSRHIVEVTYSFDKGTCPPLRAPELSESVPILRSFWHVWIPEKHHLLGYDRNFVLGGDSSPHWLVQHISQDHNPDMLRPFAGQGRALSFSRQGAAPVLKIRIVRRETLAIFVWLVVIAAGIYLLRFGGYIRFVFVLGLILVLGVWGLFEPLLIGNWMSVGSFPALLILILWFGNWLRVMWNNRAQIVPTAPLAAPPAPEPKKRKRKYRAKKTEERHAEESQPEDEAEEEG